MQTVSALYNTIFASAHTHEVKLNIAGTDYGMDVLASLKTSVAPFGTGSPVIGLAPAAEITASLYLASSSVPRMATLRPYVRLVSSDDPAVVSEWLPQGVFYVDTREQDASGVLTLHGYDAMLKFDRAQPYSTLQWPATDIDVVNELCTILGLTVDARTTALMTGGFRINLPAQYTMRETLKYIAALYGGSFVLTAAGALRLLPLWQRGSTAQHDLTASVQSLTLSPAFPACTGVRFLTEDDAEYFSGSETGYVFEITSPFATQAAATALLSHLSGFVYRPYSAEGAVLNPAAEPGDTVLIPSSAGSSTTVLSSLFSLTRTFDSLFPADASAPEDEELDHEYPYIPASERSFTRRLQNVSSELTLQAQQIAARVTRTGGDPSTFGWYLDADKFELRSDGSVVMLVDADGLTVHGLIDATSGTIGGCTIQDGVLKIYNANIENLNASKITAGTLNTNRIADYSIESTKIDDGAAVNRVIGTSAVSYGKTSFTSTLDQVGTNKANIDTLYGYFEGSAQFSSVLTGSLAINYHYLGLDTITIGGVNRQVVTWS